MTKGRKASEAENSSAFYPTLRDHCLSKDGATLDRPWGDLAFKIRGKMFACTGPLLPLRVTVKAEPGEAAALCTHPAIEPAAYVGRYGWVTVTIEDRETLRLALALVDASYGLIAPRPPRRRGDPTQSEGRGRPRRGSKG